MKDARASRYTSQAVYRGQMSRLNGPVRRGFAVFAIACVVLVAAVIVGVGLLG